MLVKARSDDFSVFIRKVGYTVGLESTLDRLRQFAEVYADSGGPLSFGTISRLLHGEKPDGWNLKSSNEHILDFLRSLQVISVARGEIGVLEVGEALGILRRLQPLAEFESGLRAILAGALIRADGDIFLNAVAARFEPKEFRDRIQRMLENKWSLLEQSVRSESILRRVYEVVNIEVQRGNPGGRGYKLGIPNRGGLAARPFEQPGMGLGLNSRPVERPDVELSDSYLAKTLLTRKSWALSLNLIETGGDLTRLGEVFLQTLAEGGMGGPCCFAVWPLVYEMSTPALRELKLPETARIMNSWEFQFLIFRALNPGMRVGNWTPEIHNLGIAKLLAVIETFRKINQSGRILRIELPVRVAYRCGLALAIGAEVPPFPEIIQREQERARPRLVARASTLAELALS